MDLLHTFRQRRRSNLSVLRQQSIINVGVVTLTGLQLPA